MATNEAALVAKSGKVKIMAEMKAWAYGDSPNFDQAEMDATIMGKWVDGRLKRWNHVSRPVRLQNPGTAAGKCDSTVPA